VRKSKPVPQCRSLFLPVSFLGESADLGDLGGMGLVTCAEMKALEESAFARGVEAEDLMDLAGRRLGEFVRDFYARPGSAVAYLGKGNNGGDALVALEVLREAGWQVGVRCPFSASELGELPQKKLGELGAPRWGGEVEALVGRPRPLVLLDGLLGIGGRGPLREPLRKMAVEMNALRLEQGAQTVAVDVPSGVDGDLGTVHRDAVMADLTCTIGVAKYGLVADEGVDHVGRLQLIPLPELLGLEGGDQILTAERLRSFLPVRAFSMHKGGAGRVGLVAGSRGYLGAAVLAATGALRGGAGLVTLYVPKKLYPLMMTPSLPPELMVKPVESYLEVLEDRLDVLALGPGLGRLRKELGKEVLRLMREWDGPMVVDADALNLVARREAWDVVDEQTLLTPHPGEMGRLLPNDFEGDRGARARALVELSGASVLFKGARTVITAPESALFYNTTGTPGMATGGQGDLLTGVLGALMGQGLSPLNAACLGAWLAGRAAERALAEDGQSEESLLPSDVAGALGRAFGELRGTC
jgi:hydroxyethylthiazole kinase-like uncharacterized protein yjeF